MSVSSLFKCIAFMIFISSFSFLLCVKARMQESYIQVVISASTSFEECQATSRVWKNSSMVIIKNQAENEAVRQEMQSTGVLRGWLGGRVIAPGSTEYLWLDGTNLSSYSNWATTRPSGSIVNGAITMEMSSGLWVDFEQYTTLPIHCILVVPEHEPTKTIVLPPFEFPPDNLPPKRTPKWQITATVMFVLFMSIFIFASCLILLWHCKHPIRIRKMTTQAEPGVGIPLAVPTEEQVQPIPALPAVTVPAASPKVMVTPPPTLSLPPRGSTVMNTSQVASRPMVAIAKKKQLLTVPTVIVSPPSAANSPKRIPPAANAPPGKYLTAPPPSINPLPKRAVDGDV